MPAVNASNKVTISNQVFGGVSDTRYLGIKDSVSKMVNFDIHSEPGIMKINQATLKISSSLVDGLIKQSVVCSNGETYLFSADSGKIWRITSDNVTMSLCYTTASGFGEQKCLGAAEYNGFIIWATELKIHRIPIANAKSETTWSTVTLNFQSFANGDKLFHPMQEQNGVLYVGDGFVMAQLDFEAWSANALDLPYPLQHRISAIAKYLLGVLTGTFVNSNVVQSIVALWNTWSVSFTFADEIPEVGVNSYLKTDNFVVANIGKKGNFYLFNGSQMEQYKRIPGNWGGLFSSNAAIANVDAQVNVNGIPMFGISNVYGNPVDQGVWSMGSYSREYPKVLNLEYIISTGNVANVEIGSICLAGSDMFITWKDNNGTPSYGVDKIDITKKAASAYFDTRVIAADRTNEKEFSVTICYRSLPTNTSITLKCNKGNAGFGDDLVLLPDVKKNQYTTKVKVKTTSVEFRVILHSHNNDAPELESCEITFA